MAANSDEILLLDLGGVLADLGDPVGLMGLGMSDDDFWSIWLNSPSVREFETGRLQTPEFAERIAAELGVADVSEFESRLGLWHLPLFPNTEDLIRSLKGRYTIALLSNTNELHWRQVVSCTTVFDSFDHLFLSFETGHYKPTEQSFLQVPEFYGCEPRQVMFLDDSEKNIAVARALGFRAAKVAGIDGVPATLAQLS